MKIAPGPSHDPTQTAVLKTVTPPPVDRPFSPHVERIRRHAHAAMYAADAYLDRKELNANFSHPSFKFDEHDDFAFFAVMEDGGTATIAFRGTLVERSSNLWADLNVLYAGTPCRHRGFMGVWELLKPTVLGWLRAHRPLRIVLTGHSLGGALALLAAYELAKDWSIEEVTVFACPRAGTPGFASTYDCRTSGSDTRATLGEITTRYVHSTDVLSRLPPPLFYKHVGQPIYLNEDGIRIQYPQPYLMRMAEVTSGASLQTPMYAPGLSGSPQVHQPDLSVLSTIARSTGPMLGYGLIPIWASCALGLALFARFFRRDIGYHDSKRYIDVLNHRRLLIERSPAFASTF